MLIVRTLWATALPLALVGTGCQAANTISASAMPTQIHSGQTSTITATLAPAGGTAPNTAQAVTFTVDAHAKFGSSLSASGTTPARGLTATASLTADPVTQDQTATVTVEWENGTGWGSWDPTGTTTVTIRPAIAASTRNGDEYFDVHPSVTPRWTFRYEIFSRNAAGGAPPDLINCTITFTVNIDSVTAPAATGSIGSITASTVAITPNTAWRVTTGAPFQQLTIVATEDDVSPGGNATIECQTANGPLTATVTGPM